MSDAPERIWLQWHGDGDPTEPGEVYVDEVTWCGDAMYDGDIEYHRTRECVWKTDWQVTSHTTSPSPIWRTSCEHISTHKPIRHCPYCGGSIVQREGGTDE